MSKTCPLARIEARKQRLFKPASPWCHRIVDGPAGSSKPQHRTSLVGMVDGPLHATCCDESRQRATDCNFVHGCAFGDSPPRKTIAVEAGKDGDNAPFSDAETIALLVFARDGLANLVARDGEPIGQEAL